MAKFYGNIGYAQMVEKKPGVWKEEIITHPYYGELVRNTRRLQSSDQLNDNITIANEISIIADPMRISIQCDMSNLMVLNGR